MGTLTLDEARGRARLCGVLGHFLLDGARPELQPMLRALDLPVPAEVSVSHTRWQLDIFPHERVFLGDGQLGASEAVHRLYAAAHFEPDRTDVEADHVGLMLRAASRMYGAQAEGHDATEVLDALVGEHLGRWLPALAVAARHHEGYAESLALAAELLPGTPYDPVLPDLLDDTRTGLKRVAEALLRPAWSGWFLSRSDLQRLSRESSLPCGFGPRVKMLESMLFTAVDHDDVLGLVEVFGAELDAWEAGYAALDCETAGWRKRLAWTRSILDRLAGAV